MAKVVKITDYEEMRFEPPAKRRQRFSRCHILRQVVPDLWTDNRKSSAADSRWLDMKHFQTVTADRAERSAARQVSYKSTFYTVNPILIS